MENLISTKRGVWHNVITKYLRKVLRVVLKVVASIILIITAIVAITSVSPIYDFKEANPFQGPDIYNPYNDFDTTLCWKRANFHTHTRVEGLMNECEYWPKEVLEAYESLHYDIVTFSNHNQLTIHPTDKELQVDVYEHGYNLFKFHKLVFGANEECYFDHILPFLTSQKQFQIDILSRGADLIQVNHPLRTPTLSQSQLERLSGYKLMELDSGKSTENEYWDSALSAGHYSFGVANDDLHYPDRSNSIAIRCNFLCTPSAKYEDILSVLNKGCFYSMRVPDYGDGDWNIKREKNRDLPYIKDIGLRDSVVYIHLSEPASLIKIVGENHTTLATDKNCEEISYAMRTTDPYARIIAYFPGGEVIYTNPFARYDSSLSDSPFERDMPQVNILLTVMFNLLLVAICFGVIFVFYRYVIKR